MIIEFNRVEGEDLKESVNAAKLLLGEAGFPPDIQTTSTNSDTPDRTRMKITGYEIDDTKEDGTINVLRAKQVAPFTVEQIQQAFTDRCAEVTNGNILNN